MMDIKISDLSDDQLLELLNNVQNEVSVRNKTTNIISSLKALQDVCAENLSEDEYILIRMFKDKSGSLIYGNSYDNVHLYDIEKEHTVKWDAWFNG
jgi:maleate cis-trans isomerase